MTTATRVFVLLYLLPTLSLAQTLVYERDGLGLFVVNIPNDWYIDTDFVDEARAAGARAGDPQEIRILEAMPMDGTKLWIGFWVVPRVSSLTEGLDYIRSLDQSLFDNIVAAPPADLDLSGMPAKIISGSAVRDAEPVEFAIALFEPKPQIIAMALYVGKPQTWARHEGELALIRDSLTPLVK